MISSRFIAGARSMLETLQVTRHVARRHRALAVARPKEADTDGTTVIATAALVGRRSEHGPAQAGDGDAGRAPVAAGDGCLAHPVPRPQVLARGPPAGEAELRVGAAPAGQPRPHREGDALAAAGAALGEVPPAQ